MRIGVVGAGAVGGTIAALLDRGGHEVAVSARGEAAAVLRERGLRLTGAWGDHLARLRASETLEGRPELAFVCVKAQDAEAAIAANRAALDDATVVVVQNGLHGIESAARLLPGAECLGGLALYAASYAGPGEVAVTTDGSTYLGEGPGDPSPATRRVAEILGAVMPAIATANFVGCQWSKLIVNQVNAMPAITGLSAQETIADARLRRIITASMREAVRVGLDSGVRFGRLQGLSHGLLSAFAAAPTALGQALPRLMARRMGATPNPGSTLQSLRRGRRTEIDHLNGAVVDAATRLGRDAPLNRALTRLVHEVEERGAFLPPATVAARVPA